MQRLAVKARLYGHLQNHKDYMAYQNVDRKDFFPTQNPQDDTPYNDAPIRAETTTPNVFYHLSAPSIYSLALSALELQPNTSFLNLGSGTGYFTTVVANIVGPQAIHHAFELHQSLVDFSRAKLAEYGHHSVQVHHGNAFSLDLEETMHFARIYVGAGISMDYAASVATLLEVGGIMVAPVATNDHSQALLKLERISELEFTVTKLMSVQFVPLAQPKPQEAPPELVQIRSPKWQLGSHACFTPEHRAAVVATLALWARADSLLAEIPKDVWLFEILPHIDYHSYLPSAARLDGVTREEAKAAAKESLADLQLGRPSWSVLLRQAVANNDTASEFGDDDETDDEQEDIRDDDSGSGSDDSEATTAHHPGSALVRRASLLRRIETMVRLIAHATRNSNDATRLSAGSSVDTEGASAATEGVAAREPDDPFAEQALPLPTAH